MRSSTEQARLRLISTAAGFLLTTALACSRGDSHVGGSPSGGRGGAITGTGGAAGAPSQGGTSGVTAGTGGTGMGGTTSVAQGGVAGTISGSGGAGGRTTTSSGGTSGTTTVGSGGGATTASGGMNDGGSGGTVGSGGLRVSGGATGAGGATGRGGATGGGIGSGGAIRGGGTGGTGGTSGAAGSGGTPSWCLPLSAHPQGIDWAKALVDSQIRANVSLTWAYPDGLFLHGVYLAYKRLGDAAYLSLIQKWADANLGGKATYNSLDDMQPTLVLDDMYRETKDSKYGKAPQAVATRLETDYPKTSDGGFWHKTDTTNQLWGDGVFMDLPPYVSYGDLFADKRDGGTKSPVDVATEQLKIYDGHLAAPNNLHVHQWDGAAGKQSCCEWCRAEGWYEMALLIVLDFTPTSHPNHDALVAIAQRLAKGLAATQDPATGRWWQVMDKPNDASNWLETSCTAMHTYFLSKASQKGTIDAATYAPLAIKGFNGEMQMVSNSSNVQVKNICPGTGVLASAADYYARPPATNDNHGLGAFLLMYDQLTCR